MTKLGEFILPEYVRKSEKLQKIECEKYYITRQSEMVGGDDWHFESVIFTKKEIDCYDDDFSLLDKQTMKPALTIADIIDNAEELFGKEKIKHLSWNGVEKSYCMCYEIVGMCYRNKSVEEISEYIIKNIK